MQRFWSKVAVAGPDDCWLWQARRDRGYGQFRYEGRIVRAHRMAYFLEHGEWPEPCCLHSCHTPACCNPAHLRAGTHAENTADMIANGTPVGGPQDPRRYWRRPHLAS